MTLMLKCPKIRKIIFLSDCFKCAHMLQTTTDKLECEIDWVKHTTAVYESNDPRLVDI